MSFFVKNMSFFVKNMFFFKNNFNSNPYSDEKNEFKRNTGIN